MKYKSSFKKLAVLIATASVSITGLAISAPSVPAAEDSDHLENNLNDDHSGNDHLKSVSDTDETDTAETQDATDSDIQQENDPAIPERSVASDTDESGAPASDPIQNINNKDTADTEDSKKESIVYDDKPVSEPETNKKILTSGTGVSLTAEKEKKQNGWKLVSGKYYYYKDDVKYTGWHYMTSAEGEKKDHWSYFGKDGVLRTGWVQLGKGTSEPDGNSKTHWSYFGANGWLRTGWVQLGKGTSEPDSNSKKHWSYFGDNGWLRTGWVQLGKGTSEPDSNSQKHWSYFGANGWLRTGWVQLGKGTSEPDGNSENHWSYFGTNGWLCTGWLQLGKGTSNPDGNSAKHWSYFGDNGWLRTFWQQLGKSTPNSDGNNPAHFSYFGANGWLVTGKTTISGKSYTFDGKGWLLAGYVNTSDANKNISSLLGSDAASERQLVADGCYRISPVKNTGYSVDVWGELTGDNTKLWSYANNSTAAQMFQIKHLGNNIYSIKTGSTIYASGWDISGGKTVAGASLVQKKYTGAATQKWKIVSAGDGAYSFKPLSGDLAVDIENGTLSGGYLKLAKPTGSNTQKFKLTKNSGFLIRNGRKYYFNQNGDKPMIGVDVSAWSETINWEKVKADGIEFAIIRASHRGGQVDRYAARNMSECTRLGIPFGVYCYSYATTNAEADHEVDVLLSVIKNYNPALGVFIDVEDNATYQAAFGNIYSAYARRKITDITKRMVNRVQNAGYLAGVYGNDPYLNQILYLDEMPNARWIARYFNNNTSDTNVISLTGKGYKIWQFTDRGYVSGIPNSGNCDLNTLIEKYW